MPTTSISPFASSSFDQEYQQMGWLLGRQSSCELTATPSPYGTQGKYRAYDYGTIHQTTRYGAIALWRDLQREYSAHQGSGGWLGFPTQREHDWTYGRRTDFEGGYINWNGQRAISYDTNATPSPYSDDSGHGSTSNWSVQFWNNQNLSGNPTSSRTDAAGELRFEAAGVPSNTTGIPATHFSARWTTQSRFDSGLYDFVSQADDGVRIYVDGVKILDKWQDQPFVRNDAFVLLSGGRHTVQVDYFNDLGSAANRLRWDPLNQQTNWTGGIQIVGYDGASVNATYNNTFFRDGGAAVLGAPINTVHPLANGYVQDFLGGSDKRGSIMKSNADDNSYWVGGDFLTTYSTGSISNTLGYPTSDRYSANGGWRQDFQGGSILSSTNGTFTTLGGIGSYYLQNEGGQKGRLGFPTSSEIGIGNGAKVQHFEHGDVLYGRGPTRTVINGAEIAIGYDGAGVNDTYINTFKRVGGSDAAGFAANNVHLLWGAYIQEFTGGSEGTGAIVKAQSTNDSFWIGGDFWKTYYAFSGVSSTLKYPVSERYAINGGERQDFQGGAIVKSTKGTFAILGGVGAYYQQFEGGTQGRLGFPTSNEMGIGNGATSQHFEHGDVLFGRGPTRTVINGAELAIGYDGSGVNQTYINTFNRVGGSNAAGFAANNVHLLWGAYVQEFSGGSEGTGAIVKAQSTNDSFWVGGDFWKTYYALSGINSALKYPVSDRYAINGGMRQDFQGGSIFKTSRGVFTVYGGIGSYYFQTAGGEKGQLGLPTSSEQSLGGGTIRQNFENGYILWNGSAIAYKPDGSLLFQPKLVASDFTGIVKPDSLNIRNGPGTNYSQVGTYARGTTLVFDGWNHGTSIYDQEAGAYDDRWFHIKGTNNWVASAYINGNPPNSSPNTGTGGGSQNGASNSFYNRQAAVDYARQYSNARNPRYHDYSNEGGNCANFVAQCLIQGGELLEKANANGYEPSEYVNADKLKNYLLTQNLAIVAGSIDALVAGDVIAYSWDGGPVMDHIALYLGNQQIASNTTDGILGWRAGVGTVYPTGIITLLHIASSLGDSSSSPNNGSGNNSINGNNGGNSSGNGASETDAQIIDRIISNSGLNTNDNDLRTRLSHLMYLKDTDHKAEVPPGQSPGVRDQELNAGVLSDFMKSLKTLVDIGTNVALHGGINAAAEAFKSYVRKFEQIVGGSLSSNLAGTSTPSPQDRVERALDARDITDWFYDHYHDESQNLGQAFANKGSDSGGQIIEITPPYGASNFVNYYTNGINTSIFGFGADLAAIQTTLAPQSSIIGLYRFTDKKNDDRLEAAGAGTEYYSLGQDDWTKPFKKAFYDSLSQQINQGKKVIYIAHSAGNVFMSHLFRDIDYDHNYNHGIFGSDESWQNLRKSVGVLSLADPAATSHDKPTGDFKLGDSSHWIKYGRSDDTVFTKQNPFDIGSGGNHDLIGWYLPAQPSDYICDGVTYHDAVQAYSTLQTRLA